MPVLGFIGTGNMGGALARAAAKTAGNTLLLANRHPEKAALLAEETGGTVTDNPGALQADYLFLGVKPQMLQDMLAGISPALCRMDNPPVLVSMVAGTSVERLLGYAGKELPVIRIMPNTPAAIGEGMILYTCNALVGEEREAEFLAAMSAAGRFAKLPEHLIDAGSGVSGCGPAFVDLFIEALADGGVACGLPRKDALLLAAQTVAGAAKLVLETGKHPGELKDAVCSPGGTTIQGVRKLEEGGLRAAVMNAVIAAYEKNFEL